MKASKFSEMQVAFALKQSPKSSLRLDSGRELPPFSQSCHAIGLECLSAIQVCQD